MKPIMIVLGGSSGIGYAICDRFKEEYQVINMSRRKSDIVDNIFCDAEDYNSIISAFKELKEKWGNPNIYIHSAGFVQPQHILEIDYETLLKTFNVNILSAFVCTQQFVKMCNKSQENKIIYISSTASLRSSPGWSAYASAKSGLNEFASCMSSELNPYVKVYCISCGRCHTPLRQILNETENKDKIMQPHHVASVIKNLINDKDNLLDGQNIVVRQITEE
jgi:NAD(P)-dependent dehydrogenase (short-subunit alcohol dehydrogenase family)